MCFSKYTSILIILLGVVTSGCIAETWDATKDFGPSNPNGAWSYGYGVTGTSFTLYSIYNPDCGQLPGWVCWQPPINHMGAPLVGFNTTGDWLNWWTLVIPPDVLLLHPGPSPAEDSIVQWTAPMAGAYSISGFFEILDTDPTGIFGFVFDNDTLLYSGELIGPPAQHPDQVGGREDFFFPALNLNKGDVISFAVNYDGNYFFDSTGFNATIDTIPEPGSLALLGSGLLGLGVFLRTRLLALICRTTVGLQND